jgi:diguanylate cyclase (GGDEF)-like protein/PAS domain S-box-containing protein
VRSAIEHRRPVEDAPIRYAPFVAIALLSGLLLLLGGLDGVESNLANLRRVTIDALGETPGPAGEFAEIDRRLALLPLVLVAMVVGPLLAMTGWRRGMLAVATVSAGLFAVSAAIQAGMHLVLEVSPILVTVFGCFVHVHLTRADLPSVRGRIRGRRRTSTEALMNQVVQNSFDAVVTLAPDGTIETFNRSAEKMFGRTAHDAFGRNLNELVRIGSAKGESGWVPIHQLRDSKVPCEATGRDRDGSDFPLEVTMSTTIVDGVRRRIAFLRDITWRKAQQELLQHQATHDSLTGLPNRYQLEKRTGLALHEAAQKSGEVAFLLLDLDRFKEINDTLGHHTGDLLLQRISERLNGGLTGDQIMARLGGDEFAVLLPDAGEETARRVADELNRLLTEPFSVEGLTLKVDATVGIALFPRHGSDAIELIQRADVAMYSAKKCRSDAIVYDPRQDSSSMRQLTLTSELRLAIDHDGLGLVYQPKIDARTLAVVGAEALVRWEHEELGTIRPDEFIDLAENTGLIRPLTRWVLRTALIQCAEWHERNRKLGISINLSARNLLEEDLPETLRAVLDESHLPPEYVTLEITENAIMEDPERALEVVIELVSMGVAISIDDFGTGYSSLGYLRRLPASELKIDRCFVQEMDRNADDATIVHSTIELAHNLGLKVVAEGIESLEIWKTLRDQGCDFGQGYAFSRPLGSDDLLKWIDADKRAAKDRLAGAG